MGDAATPVTPPEVRLVTGVLWFAVALAVDGVAPTTNARRASVSDTVTETTSPSTSALATVEAGDVAEVTAVFDTGASLSASESTVCGLAETPVGVTVEEAFFPTPRAVTPSADADCTPPVVETPTLGTRGEAVEAETVPTTVVAESTCPFIGETGL